MVEIEAGEGEDFKPAFDEKGNPWICLVRVPQEGTEEVIGYVYDAVLVRRDQPIPLEGLPIVLPVEYFVEPTPAPTPTETPTPTPEFTKIPEIQDFDFYLGFASTGKYGLLFGDLQAGGDRYFVYFVIKIGGGSGDSYYSFTPVAAEGGGYKERKRNHPVQLARILPQEDGTIKVRLIYWNTDSSNEKSEELVLKKAGRGKEVFGAIYGLIWEIGKVQTPRKDIIKRLKEAGVDTSSLP